MNLKIIYPVPRRQYRFYRLLREMARYLFVIAGAVCLLINFLLKGKAWSIIVVWSLIMAWRILFSLRLVEFSIYSHAIKVVAYLVVLLILIDRFLAPGWARTVVPIVVFGYLLVMFIIFFITYGRRRRHLMSITMLGILNLMLIPYSSSWPIRNWVAFAFQIASIVLFIVMIIVNFRELRYELKARFMMRTK